MTVVEQNADNLLAQTDADRDLSNPLNHEGVRVNAWKPAVGASVST